MNSKKIALLGLLTALSVIMFLVESLFPPLIIPGAKLGLGNIFVMLCLIYLGYSNSVILVVVKCLMAGIFGGFSQIMYSLPAGLISLTIAFLMLKFIKNISIVAISASASVIHNLVQNCVFAIIVKSHKVLLYAPYLTLLGVLCGILTGLTVYFINKNLSKKIIKNINIKEKSV